MPSTSDHWNDIYATAEESKLGWYEENADQTFELLKEVPVLSGSTVFLAGAGTTGLIESLLNAGSKLIVNDISSAALERVKERLSGGADDITWLCQDIAKPIESAIPPVDVWLDRAVLHFLTADKDIQGYFDNVNAALTAGGHVLFAEYTTGGAERCAGLPVHQYSAEELSDRLGADFALVNRLNHTYINPHGDPKLYIYALFKRAAQPHEGV